MQFESHLDKTHFDAEWADLGRSFAKAKFRLDKEAAEPFRVAHRAYRGEKRVPSYFERKWLSLRLSAVKRGMIVDATVTPRFLERVTDGRCPVTLEDIDVAGKSRSRPTIDRLVNEVTYLAGNICVLSGRANSAKGDKTFEEVAAIAQAGERKEGLEPVEWMRLTSLMYGAWAHAYKQGDPYLLPLAAMPGEGMFMSTSQAVQLLLTRHYAGGVDNDAATRMWLKLTAEGSADVRLFDEFRLCFCCALEQEEHAGNAWLHGPVFDAFVIWFNSCHLAVTTAIADLLSKHQATRCDPVASRDWTAAVRRQA